MESIKLRKELGLINATSLILGTIIGAGVFVSPTGVFVMSGSVAMTLLVWFLSGVISLGGALCYAELGTTITKSGADYAYQKEAFGSMFAFIQLWVNVIILRPTGIAIQSLTFSYYLLQPLFLTCEPPGAARRLLAACCIVIVAVVNVMSVRLAARMQTAFAVAKLTALLLITATGFVMLGMGKTEHLREPFEGTVTDVGKLSLAFYSALYSYYGWNNLNFVTEEVRDPHRTLPRAIYLALPLATAVYVFANLAYLTILSPAEITASPAVAVYVASKLYGVMAWVIPFFVALNCFGTVNGLIFVAGRQFFVGARDGQMPEFLAMIHPERRTPIPATILTATLALLMLVMGNIYTLINYIGFTRWLSTAGSVVGLLYMRWSRPDLARPVKVPLGLVVTFLLVSAFLLIMPLYASPYDTGMGCLITLSGLPVYGIFVAWRNKPKSVRKFMARLTVTSQKLLLVVPTDYSDSDESEE